MPTSTPHRHPLARLPMTFLKLAIAIAGIWWVAHKTNWYDSATLPAGGPPINTLTFVHDTPVTVLEQSTTPAGKPLVRIRFPDTPVTVRTETPTGDRTFDLVLSDNPILPGTDQHLQLSHEITLPLSAFKQDQGQLTHQGLHSLLLRASSKWYLLAFAWLLLGTPFFVTAIRWRGLMRPQGIDMPLAKCLQLTFVGQFYSILLPGITGGDLVKIVYAARLTGSKTKSFITIILDRVIGLVALMAIAGASAGIQLLLNLQQHAPVDNTLLNVFLMILALLACLAAGATVYFSHRLRRLIGITWFIDNFSNLTNAPDDPSHESPQHAHLERLFYLNNILLLTLALLAAALLASFRWLYPLPWAQHNTLIIYIGLLAMALLALAAAAALAFHTKIVNRLTPLMQKIVSAVIRVDETLHVYRGHSPLLAWAFFISLISQLSLPLSAWLAGLAFGMHAPPSHYLAYVPLALLAASLPISPPQGIGVFEYILNHFFVDRGAATAAQVVALAQSIRFLPLLWNLLGAYWIITGQYSRAESPTKPPTPTPVPTS